jgi:hypothetical protein
LRKHCIIPGHLERGYADTIIIEIPEIGLKLGTYPLYFWLGSSDKGETGMKYEERRPYDVVDDLTSPLIIYSTSEEDSVGFVDLESYVKSLRP